MTMDIYESLFSFTVNICFQNAYSEKTKLMLLLLMFLVTPPPDIQHLIALAMFFSIVCTRPPPDPILDIGHRLIGDRENMLTGRNVYVTFVAHPHAFFLITSQTSDSFTGM